jgi:hypothetical protein
VVPSLDHVVLEWEGTPPAPRRRARFLLAEVLLDVDTDDPPLLDELASLLGRPQGGSRSRAAPLRLGRVRATAGRPLRPPEDRPVASRGRGPAELLIGLGSEDFPFHL